MAEDPSDRSTASHRHDAADWHAKEGDRLKQAAAADIPSLFTLLQSREEGLADEAVLQRRAQSGLNEIASESPSPWYVQLVLAFITPFNAVLLSVATVSLFMDVFAMPPDQRDYKTVIVVCAMVLLSSLLRFRQEFQSSRAAQKLKSMVKTTATVLRTPSGKTEVSIKEVVPGDVVILSAGNMIPADCRVIRSKDLFINQAVLTGEALPVEKTETALPDADQHSPLEATNLCFMGTNVVSGSAITVVVNTGSRTFFGTISKSLTGKRAETSFDKGVRSVSWLLIRFMIIMVPLVFLINGLTKGNWLEALLFAIAVAVGLTPEMLPMIVTANLAKGAVNMSKRKVIVKRINAIQNIGAMNVLCTDKTGTLTLDKIVLERHLNVDGEDDEEVLKWAYLNSFHQTGLASLMDQAVLNHAGEVHKLIKPEEAFVKVDEIPFDFQRRRMSVILRQQNGKHLLICKGAVEEMLALSTHAFDPGEDHELHIEMDESVPMDDSMRQRVKDISSSLNAQGMRVLLVSVREFEPHELTYSVADESDMTVAGFIGFLDPAKPSAKPSVEALRASGVELKVLTGDNEIVTRKICGDVGIPVQNILLGSDLDRMNDEELKEQLEKVSILAKLSPEQKQRVIRNLQQLGHTVGYLGDGINDAPALREADVGISVDSAVDIAKESADIILLENDLMVLHDGVTEGRRTFGNIIKYIKMTASSNFGNMFSMLGASALFPFLPMMPIQILVQNLFYDFSQGSIPWDRMDDDYIREPKKWDASGIARFMMFIGPVSSIFDYVTFAVMYWFFRANTADTQTLFQSGWFVEGLLSQTLIVHMIRTRRIPFLQSTAATPVIVLTLLIALIGLWLPFSPFAAALKLTPLPPAYFLWLLGIIVSYALLTQAVKAWFIRRFNYWL